MKNLGDYSAGKIIYGKFNTFQPSTGVPFTLAGTPALSVYKDNSTTQSTSGIALTINFDSVTGFHHYAIDTSSDPTFYSAGSNFDIVVTTGTVDSVSFVGAVVGTFTIAKTSALRPTVADRTLDVTATGEAGIDFANIGAPTTTVNLSGTTIGTVTTTTTTTNLTNLPAAPTDWLTAAAVKADAVTKIQNGLATATALATVQADTDDIQTRLPAALVSGRMDSYTGSMATDVITSGALATSAVTEIQTGLATSSALSTVQADTDDIQSRLPAALISGRMDVTVGAMQANTLTASALATNAVDKIADGVWDELLSGHTTTGTAGKALADASTGSSLTVQDIVDGVWDESMAAHLTPGSTGASLNGAGSAGDPWTTPLPGAYAPGTAGAIIGGNLDVKVSTRLAPTVAGRTIDVTTGGAAGIDWANIEGANSTVSLSATTLAAVTAVTTVTTTTNLTNLPTMPADWLTASGLSSGAVAEIQTGLATSTALTVAQNDLDDIQTRLPAALVGGRMDASVGALANNAITAASIAAGALNGKGDWLLASGYTTPPTADQNAAGLLNLTNGIETGLTLKQAIRLIAAASAGELSGANTATVVIRNAVADSKNRITASVDQYGNRNSVTVDLSD